MSTLMKWRSLGAALALLACSEDDPNPSNTGGTSSGGAAGGMSGSAAGGASGSTTGGGGGNSAGTSSTAGASAGVGGSSTSMAGSSSGSAGAPSAGAGGSGAGGSGGVAGVGGGGGGSAEFELTSPAFEHVEACSTQNRAPCDLFPEVNTYTNIGGANQSPELNWGAGPAGTMSYVVCLHDTSVGANGATHWCLWNIPGATRQLPANLARQKMPAVPSGASQDNLFDVDEGYVGPGARGNVYQFRLYALSVASYNPPNAEDRRTVYNELEQDPDDIVLATSTLRGRANPDQ